MRIGQPPPQASIAVLGRVSLLRRSSQPAPLKVSLEVATTLGCLVIQQSYRYQTFKRSSYDVAASADAGRDDSYSSLDQGVLKVVTHLAWETIPNPIIYAGASYALLLAAIL